MSSDTLIGPAEIRPLLLPLGLSYASWRARPDCPPPALRLGPRLPRWRCRVVMDYVLATLKKARQNAVEAACDAGGL